MQSETPWSLVTKHWKALAYVGLIAVAFGTNLLKATYTAGLDAGRVQSPASTPSPPEPKLDISWNGKALDRQTITLDDPAGAQFALAGGEVQRRPLVRQSVQQNLRQHGGYLAVHSRVGYSRGQSTSVGAIGKKLATLNLGLPTPCPGTRTDRCMPISPGPVRSYPEACSNQTSGHCQ